MISVHFQGKPFNITVIQVYAPTANAKEAEIDQFYEDLENLLRLIPCDEKGISFLVLVLEGLVDLHRTIRVHLLWH